MELIPTKFKVKIPQSDSYPLGAQEISAGLEGVPQRDLLSIWSRWRGHYYRYREGSKFPGLNRDYLLGCTLGRRTPTIRSSRAFDEHQRQHPVECILWVYSVPRVLRHSIHGMMKTKALPELRSWLLNHETPKEVWVQEEIGFFYDTEKEELGSFISRK
jgi:hypothetical protein